MYNSREAVHIAISNSKENKGKDGYRIGLPTVSVLTKTSGEKSGKKKVTLSIRKSR